MKKQIFVFLAVILLPLASFAQEKSLFLNGNNQFAEFNAPPDMPAGASARTLEFWLKIESGAKNNRQSIIELGEQNYPGSAFGIHAEFENGVANLRFWGNNVDLPLGKIPDDQWHFVAITYSAPNLKSYIDGELTSSQNLTRTKLNTKIGKAYLGGFPARGWMLKGSLDNVAIWNRVRTAAQVKQDMIPFPCLNGNENGLILSFKLNEGQGNSFRDTNAKVTANLIGGNLWTKNIKSNPTPIDEGIWFVIQNKSDLDTDFGIPARRMALRVNDENQIEMASIPLTGNYDNFLWRTVKLNDGSNKFKLVNKKLGLSKALDSSQTNPAIGDFGNFSGQIWLLTNENKAAMGTNAFSMSNDFITNRKALAFNGNQIIVANKRITDTKQTWIFQPMELASGYHLPKAEDKNCPFTKKLTMSNGFTVYGTNTVSDWAMLNAHLILSNQMNALNTNSLTAFNKKTNITRREVQIISRYDDNKFVAQYPLIAGIWSQEWMTKYRGGNGYDPDRQLNIVTITEEMMCKTGVFTRGADDNNYREFEQVVHEFAHATDQQCEIDSSSFSEAQSWGENKMEWFPWQVQYWLNSAHSEGANKNRATLSPKVKTYLSQYFNPANTWLPPRKLRD